MDNTTDKFKDIAQGQIKKAQQLQVEVLQKMLDLAIAGFGLVAALAWNEAIAALFEKVFPQTGGVIAKFVYAALVTIIVVFVTIRLGKMLNLAKSKAGTEQK